MILMKFWDIYYMSENSRNMQAHNKINKSQHLQRLYFHLLECKMNLIN